VDSESVRYQRHCCSPSYPVRDATNEHLVVTTQVQKTTETEVST
jgi:hypothetical protein